MSTAPAEQPRSGRFRFTKVDLLVTCIIIAIVFGLLVPLLSKVREPQYRMECASNLRQIGIASHSYAGDNRTLPQAATYGDGGADTGPIQDVARYDAAKSFHYGWAFAIIPYVQAGRLYKEGGNPPNVRAGDCRAWKNKLDRDAPPSQYGKAVASQITGPYSCPADSGRYTQFMGLPLSDGKGWARGNYAANAGPALITESINGKTVAIAWAGAASPAETLIAAPVMAVNYGMTLKELNEADGSSNTILFNEVRIGLHEMDLRGTWALAVPGASITCGNAGRQGSGAYQPIDRCSRPNDATPGSDDIQGCPDPGDGSWERDRMGCKKNPAGSFFAQARSRHAGGVNICLGDGSTRFVRNEINNLTWFYLLSAKDGKVVPDY